MAFRKNKKVAVKEPVKLKNNEHVYVIRDWKEYLGESLLIIFSVLLALFLTERVNNLHEKKLAGEMVKNIIQELENNRKAIEETQTYDKLVLKNIDSFLTDKNAAMTIVTGSEFHLSMIAPDGILYRYLNSDAWEVAKNNDIMSKLDLETLSVLVRVYEDQSRMEKVEDEVAKVIFDRSSRDPEQVRTTLVLIKDLYHGWAVDRIPGLLYEIDTVIKKLEESKIYH
jgi:hypothetical protein